MDNSIDIFLVLVDGCQIFYILKNTPFNLYFLLQYENKIKNCLVRYPFIGGYDSQLHLSRIKEFLNQ